jgi:hypothetical protein
MIAIRTDDVDGYNGGRLDDLTEAAKQLQFTGLIGVAWTDRRHRAVERGLHSLRRSSCGRLPRFRGRASAACPWRDVTDAGSKGRAAHHRGSLDRRTSSVIRP